MTAPPATDPRTPAGAPLLALSALAILPAVAMNLYMPALPDIGDWFGVDIQRIELSVSLFLIGLGAGQILGAPVSDRLGRRPSTQLGLALFAAATVGVLLAASADQFVVLRLVQGVALGMATVNMAAVIADLGTTQDTARSLSLIQLAQAVGHIVTPIVGALLVGVLLWQSSFWIMSAYCVLLGAYLWIRLPETVARSKQRGRRVFREAVRRYRTVLGKPRAIAYAIGVSFAAGSTFVYFTDAAFVYSEWFGLGPRPFGLLLALSTVSYMGGAILNVRLIARHRAERLVPVGCGVLLLAALLLLAHVVLMTPSLPVVVALAMMIAGSLGILGGNAAACFLAHFPQQRATASGIVGSLPNVVGGAVGAGLDVIHDGTLLTTALGIGACALVATVAFAFARPVEPAADDADRAGAEDHAGAPNHPDDSEPRDQREEAP